MIFIWAAWKNIKAARWLNRAAGLFVASLVCRAVDQPLCDAWPAGTHLGWHLINAAMLWCCMRGLLATLLRAFQPEHSDSRLLVTSRYPFTLLHGGLDLAAGLLELPLGSFSATATAKQRMAG